MKSDDGDVTFKRDLGLFSLVTMSLGTMIGSAWLVLPGIVASQAGPASCICWILAGVAMLIMALLYSELGAAWPAAGAVAKYPYLSHGGFAGHLGGWAALIAYLVTPPAEAVAVTRYAGAVAPSLVNSHGNLSSKGILAAISILGVLALLNLFGVKYLARFQNWVTVIKFLPIAAFLLVVGILGFHPGNFTHYGGFTPMGGGGILLGTAGTVFAYIGFRQALDFGAEAKQPGRDLPLALIITILIGMVTYVLLSVVFVGGINWPALAHWGVEAGGWTSLGKLSAPLFDLTTAAGFGTIAWLIFVDGILSPNGPNATNIGTVPRVAFTMAQNGSLPRAFTVLHPRFGTPAIGLGICFCIESALVFASGGEYDSLISAVNVAFLMAFAMGPVAFTVLRKTDPDTHRPFRLRGGRILAPLGFALSSLLMFWSKWPLTGLSLAFMVTGALVYAGYAAAGKVDMGSIKHGIWLIAYLLSMALVSYLGGSQFGGRGIIPYGLDILTVVIVSLGIYYWGVSQGVRAGAEIASDKPRSNC